MFFDHLLKRQSLKFRLLGSTSFAQLYSAERLPLHKFRKEGAMLSPLIAGLLAACGGGGVIPIGGSTPRPVPEQGSRNTPTVPGNTIFDATGSEIEGAEFYIDADGDGVLSDEERIANHLGTSNSIGQISVSNEKLLEMFGEGDDAKTSLSIIADLENAKNLNTGEEYDFGDFRSEANSFTATGDLPVTFYGGGGNDTLKGAGGPAHLYGGKTHDTLIGGSNDDVLTGGDGKDVFVA